MRQNSFDTESDAAFAFVDPVLAMVLSESVLRQDGLFSDLLFRKGEAGEGSVAGEIFDV